MRHRARPAPRRARRAHAHRRDASVGCVTNAALVVTHRHSFVRPLTLTLASPCLAAYLGELHASQLDLASNRAATGAVGAFTASLEHLLSPSSLHFEDHLGAAGSADGPMPSFRALPGGHAVTGLNAAVLHAALRVACGPNPAFKEALYGPLLQQHRRRELHG